MNSAISPNGKKVEIDLAHFPSMFNGYSYGITSDPRQITRVDIYINDKEYYCGRSTHNPHDTFVQEIGNREAIKDALKALPREERTDIWVAINEILDKQKLAKSILTVDYLFRKYGREKINQMLGFEAFNNEEICEIDETGEQALKAIAGE